MIALLLLLASFTPTSLSARLTPLCQGVTITPAPIRISTAAAGIGGIIGYGVISGCAMNARAACDSGFTLQLPRTGLLLFGDEIAVGSPLPQVVGTRVTCVIQSQQGPSLVRVLVTP